jgi:tRNA ligase
MTSSLTVLSHLLIPVGEANVSWETLKSTIGPYEITIKENGCIIFVSTISDHLLVTSKHALDNPHAQKGHEWLLKTLESSGTPIQNLIDFIQKHNVTIVFELADDDFEEHVLEYPKHKRGLYLHGINQNTPVFNTWSMNKVQEFAKEFGFMVVDTIVVDTLDGIACLLYYNYRNPDICKQVSQNRNI